MYSPPETRYARTLEGAHLAYQVFGDGPLDLIFPVNGGFAIDLIWEVPSIAAFLGRLASWSRLVLFDPRGFGSSSRVEPGRVPAVQTWMDDIGTVMDAAGSSRAAFVAWGESALAVMLFAATYPQRVTSLVLANAYARFLRDDECPWGMPFDSFSSYIDGLGAAWGTGLVTGTTAPSLAQTEEALKRWARVERLSATPDVIVIPRAFMESDVTQVLPLIQAPALILTRQGARHVHPDHGSYLANRILSARLLELPGDDDVIFAGSTDELLDEIQEFVTGTRSAALVNRVLATVLFTDIVSSTEHAANMGDRAWREVLDSYEMVARSALDQFRGREIKSTGDGTLATFDGPARAVECARAIMERVAPLGVEVRAGIHTGEIELRGDDVAGLGVHIAARISGHAEGSVVLVSRTLTDLVMGSGIEFEDRGEYELKGVPGTWKLFAVAN